MVGRYVVTRQNRPFQFSCTGVQVRLTTKLTTCWLDVLGRRWTIHGQDPWIQGQFRRRWTILDSAPRASQPQVAGAIPVPPALANAEFMQAAATLLAGCFCVL